jgi:hypothetical protein
MKYHLGCGSIYLPGYTNVDFPSSMHLVNTNVTADIYADILKMPLNKCQEIRSSHVFEHFSYVSSMYLLFKWYNALEVGGLLRIALPDVERLSQALIGASVEKSFRIIRYLYGSHEDPWAYHINGWTEKTLSYILDTMGLSVVEISRTGEVNSDYPNCSLDILSIKKDEKDKKDLLDIMLNFFKFYKNGDTDFENKLEIYFKQKLSSLVNS